jgi:predicted RNA-binding protein with PIN domain
MTPDPGATEGRPVLEDLPAAANVLVEGLGIYLRGVPRRELPGALRRFAGLRARALTRHRADLLRAIELAEVRAALLEWLERAPRSLSGPQEAVLRDTCERSEGWEERLAAISDPPRTSPKSAPGAHADLAREREKTRRARAEIRAARDGARRDVTAERARSTALAKEGEELRRALDAARRELAAARAEVQQASLRAERELRRARRDAERARASREELRGELKGERRRAAALERRLERLEPDAPSPGRPRPTSSAPRSAPGTRRRRRPLGVPRGRPGDDVDTLDEWLTHDDVCLLVDGYNVTKAPGGFGGLALEAQRERLVAEIERLARRRGVRAIVVFDGSDVAPGTQRRRRGPVEVHYSLPDEPADDHLVALLRELPPDPVVVVTSDRDLQERVRERGATVARARQLLELIR